MTPRDMINELKDVWKLKNKEIADVIGCGESMISMLRNGYNASNGDVVKRLEKMHDIMIKRR